MSITPFEKFEELMRNHYDETTETINQLYSEKFNTKKNKTYFTFKVNGKSYNHRIVTRNYINFMTDVSEFMGYKTFKELLKNYVSKEYRGFPVSHIKNNQFSTLHRDIIISHYSSNICKKSHIQKICDYLSIPVEFTVKLKNNDKVLELQD